MPEKAKRIQKAFSQLLESKEQLPPKVPHKSANKDLLVEVKRLDRKVHLAPEGTEETEALQHAQEFSDKHFVVSSFFPKYKVEGGGAELEWDEVEIETEIQPELSCALRAGRLKTVIIVGGWQFSGSSETQLIAS